MERIRWIDFFRGLSMIAILVFHTEMYYKEHDATPYYIYTTNAILVFYFLSGCLFQRGNSFCLRHKLAGIARTMLYPYFVFTSLIAVPKLLARHESIVWQDIVVNILSGRASWFIAALIVAEVLFSLALVASRGRRWLLPTLAAACFVAYYLVPFDVCNFWQWQDAMLAFAFLYAGFLCCRHELWRWLRPGFLLFLLPALVGVKVLEWHLDLPTRNIAVECAPLFLLDAVLTLLAVLCIARLNPRSRLVEWTGRHSIVYYFLCGGCPLMASALLRRLSLPYDGGVLRFLLAALLAYALATALTWAIYRYVPFLVRVKRVSRKAAMD